MKSIIKILFISILISSCATNNRYNGLTTITENSLNYYLVENIQSDKLLIYIDGSGYESVLGIQNDDGSWKYTKLAEPLINATKKDYNIMIPEKPFFEKGKNYNSNKEALQNAGVESIIKIYTIKIDSFLSKNKYKDIIMIGSSDGGALLPKIYDELEYKECIDKLVILAGGGGVSQLDEFKILAKSSIKMPEAFRNELLKIEIIESDVKSNPSSIELFYLGHPYTRWSSFFQYKPIEYIKNIPIPILFIHGEKDWSCPVESTRIIEDQKISNDFDFYYYKNMGHSPTNIFQMMKLKKDILNWIEF